MINIELKQTEATKVYDDGDYEITLKKPITLYENDTINIKNIFIDTKQQQTGIFEFDDDQTFTFEFLPYLSIYGDYTSDVSLAFSSEYKGQPFYACPYKITDHGSDPSGQEYIIGFTFKELIGDDGKYPEKWGAIENTSIGFTYFDLDGNQKAAGYKIPLLTNTTPNKQDTYTLRINPIPFYQDPNKQPFFEDELKEYNIDNDVEFIKTTATKKVCSLVPLRCNVSIPKGIYTYQEFCDEFNKEINNSLSRKILVANSTNDYSKNIFNNGDNSFFTTVSTTYYKMLELGFSEPYNPTDLLWVSTDDPDLCFQIKLEATSTFLNQWIGASQIQLEYDTVYNKFKFVYFHTPIYDYQGNIILKNDVYSENNETFLNTIGTYSGVILTQCDDFFLNDLGFGALFGENKVVLSSDDTISAGDFEGQTLTLENGLKIGINTTSGYVGNANLFRNSDGATPPNAVFEIVPTPDQYKTLQTTTGDTYEIYAEKEINSQTLSSGYYLLELDCLTNNTMINKDDILSKISGIVSRYYTVGSYTSAGGESSLTYIHQSEIPLTISTFRVRILNDDKQLASDIGDDNSLYIQIERA